MATTEHITVLFTDLVGSTELATSLEPDAADHLRRMHFSALRQAIATAGGTEVKNLGDGLMVVFPAASTALSCAVAMQQAVDRDNAGAERPLGLRAGLSSGEATREGDDYFGDPVIEAARLCAQADAGQILASDVVRVSAGRRSSHQFTALGGLELKGLPEPVETLEVGWEPLGPDVLTPGRVPLPNRLGHRPDVGVIGRDAEIAMLEAAAKRVASGEGREVVLVFGEPGQGKTTLVSEFARRVYDARMTVLLGRSDEEVGAPYLPFHDAISHFIAHADEDLLRSHVAAHGGELDRMTPALRQRLGDIPAPRSTDADTERYLLYAAVAALMEAAGADAPVVLVLDDLHWADKPSLQLLRHVVTNAATSRLLVVGTFRDAELSPSHPLAEALVALRREPAGVSSIGLEGLNDTGVIIYMESAAGHALDETGVGLAEQVYRETDGNPFFVAEMLRNLAESGAIVRDEHGYWAAADAGADLALPHSLRAVIGTRVSRLGAEASKALAIAAVIGRDFDLDLLAETSTVEEDMLIDLLDDAQRAALVTELSEAPGRYSFSHALIQHTLYEDLGPTRQSRLHRVVGEAIERRYGTAGAARVSELARHFALAAQPANAEKAIAYSQRAGEAALDSLAPDDAVRHFTRALELERQLGLPEPHRRVELLIGLGTAQRQVGDPAYRDTLLHATRAALDSGAIDAAGRAVLANNRGFMSIDLAIDHERVEMIEAVVAVTPAQGTPRRARLLGLLGQELTNSGDYERRRNLSDQALEIARDSGDSGALLDVLVRRIATIWTPETLDERLAISAEAEAIADTLDDPIARFWSADFRITSCVEAADVAEFRRCVAVEHAIAAQTGQPILHGTALQNEAVLALLAGDAYAAEALANESFEVFSQIGDPDAVLVYGALLGGIRAYQGRLAEMLALFEEADLPDEPVVHAAFALFLTAAGRVEDARALLTRETASGFAYARDLVLLSTLSLWVDVAIGLGDTTAATLLYQRLEPWPAIVVYDGSNVRGAVVQHLGDLAVLLGRDAAADAHFAGALEIHERLEAPFHIARTHLAWGAALLARGASQPEARGHLEAARDLATRYGCAGIEDRAVTLLTTGSPDDQR